MGFRMDDAHLLLEPFRAGYSGGGLSCEWDVPFGLLRHAMMTLRKGHANGWTRHRETIREELSDCDILMAMMARGR